MGKSSKSKRVEIREFWEEAIRLRAEGGLSVRAFCNREGLAEHTFYSWRRKLRPERPARDAIQSPSATPGSEAPADSRRRRPRKPVANSASARTGAVEFLPVRVVGDEGSRTHAVSVESAAGVASIELVGTSPWRVRILPRFDPTILAAVLAVLEQRPC